MLTLHSKPTEPYEAIDGCVEYFKNFPSASQQVHLLAANPRLTSSTPTRSTLNLVQNFRVTDAIEISLPPLWTH